MKTCGRKLLVVLSMMIIVHLVHSQTSSDIRFNQLGFYPTMTKIAVVRNAANVPFYVVTPSLSDTLVKGTLSAAQTWPYSNESVSIADFSTLQIPGTYQIIVPGVGTTSPFEIKERVHQNLAIGALKGYYYQRASLALLPTYAGTWARALGHPDTDVRVHPSAATTQRPAGTSISCPRGWYDAGDYNKYVVNSGISTYTLLATYEWFPEFCTHLSTNIPESRNGIPDILNEGLWNIRWMLTMQDPNDGGVYSKCTDPNFDAFEMPWNDTQTRYVVQKSTAATLDFAAVMAQTARITTSFSSQLPGFADSCRQAALNAWKWARQNPAIYYNQVTMNSLYSPAITTGDYGDGDVSDEFIWAASELFVTTAQDSFLAVANPSASYPGEPYWGYVQALGMISLAKYTTTIAAKVDTNVVRSRLLSIAAGLRSTMSSSAYRVAMGNQSWNFVWGSNSTAANQGMLLLIAYRLTGDSTYLNAALSNLDYLLGRNGTTYCFVTGFGTHSPQHIHHRISGSDGIAAPVPGLLAGGPNPNQEDGSSTYPSKLPGLSYTDDQNAYACNEICINWNAPLVFLSIGMEAVLSPNVLPASVSQDKSNVTMPKVVGLLQNYPNPFNPSTTIKYELPTGSHVTLSVYDILGREVSVLVNEKRDAGVHEVKFAGSGLSSGVYFYRMQAGSFLETKRLLLLR